MKNKYSEYYLVLFAFLFLLFQKTLFCFKNWFVLIFVILITLS